MKKEYKKPTIITTIFSFEAILKPSVLTEEDERKEEVNNEEGEQPDF